MKPRLLPLLFLLPLAAVSTWLRFRHLTELELCHWDEGAYAAGPFGTQNYASPQVAPLYAPPLFPMLARVGFELFSWHAWAAISISALAGTLTVFAVYALARALLGDGVALASAGLLATCQYHVIFSRLALTDALFLLWFVLAIHAWWRSLERGCSWAVLAGALAGVATWTKYHGALALAIGAVGSVIAAWPADRAWWRRASLRALLAVAAYLPFLVGLVIYLHVTVGLPQFLAHRSRWATGLHLWSMKQTTLFLAQCLTSWIAWPVLVCAAVGALVALRRRARADLLMVTWLVLYLGALYFYQNFPRLLLPLLPPLCVLAATGAIAMTSVLRASRTRLPLSQLVVVVLLVVSLPGAFAETQTSTTTYARVASFLRERVPNGARVIVLAQPCVLFYLAGKPLVTYTRSHGDEDATLAALRSGDFDYLVTDQRLLYTPDFKAVLDQHPERFQEIASFRNDAPDAVLLDRLAYADVRRVANDPTDPELELARSVKVFVPRR